MNLLIGLIDVPSIHKSIPVYLSNLYLADASTFFLLVVTDDLGESSNERKL